MSGWSKALDFSSLPHNSDFYYYRVLCISCILLIIFVYVFSCIYWILICSCINCVILKYRVFVYYNKFHCQLRKICTYLLHSMHEQLQYILLLLYMNLHVQYLCCLFHICKCKYKYNPWPKFFKGGGRGKTNL